MGCGCDIPAGYYSAVWSGSDRPGKVWTLWLGEVSYCLVRLGMADLVWRVQVSFGDVGCGSVWFGKEL